MNYIGLLRAVNLAGRNTVGMADLRDLLTELGLQGVRSLLQSGNVVFQSRGRTTAQLERMLEEAAAKRLGLKTDFFVRTPAELAAVVAGNPFRREAAEDPGHLLVVFLKRAPSSEKAAGLQRTIRGREVARVEGRHAFIVYPDGVGRSRLTGAVIEKALATRGTGRNWNTVLKLQALAGSS